MSINRATRKLVRSRASFLCEYCHSAEESSSTLSPSPFRKAIACIFVASFTVGWGGLSRLLVSDKIHRDRAPTDSTNS
jgi:hypothetical protein